MGLITNPDGLKLSSVADIRMRDASGMAVTDELLASSDFSGTQSQFIAALSYRLPQNSWFRTQPDSDCWQIVSTEINRLYSSIQLH